MMNKKIKRYLKELKRNHLNEVMANALENELEKIEENDEEVMNHMVKRYLKELKRHSTILAEAIEKELKEMV